ncbi:Crp-like helix-turn-helix protein [Xylophilus ampelinus]|uniref:Crp-like helix-turn-helix protein n=2 Tax=Xylophilus ampelinus TaxID=54067 RepID=A0A318SHA5_9BURK|nr:Crp-like helix-turn-helix protein [Xylophilus ampelinus]
MIGNEGMLGAHLAQGIVTAPFQAIVQGSGSALRLSATVFAEELHRIPQFHRQVQRYLYVQMVQFATSAACQKFHQIGPRLARWLLMSQDRAHRDNFYVTHEFLGYMLGVRRVGITTAAIALQRSGLINYQRGELVVLDRVGLEAQACSCYAKDKQTYTSTLS